MGRWIHFTDGEVKGLDTELVAMLDMGRALCNHPFIITRGLSTAEENSACGGVKNSAHLRGLAVDLACEDSMQRFEMIKALFAVGFSRIGIYEKHLHADRDESLPQAVCWWSYKP